MDNKESLFGTKHKVTFAVMACILIGFFIVGAVSYRQIYVLFLNQIKDSAMIIASQAAKDVDGEALLDVSERGDEAYKKVYDEMEIYLNYNIIEYIYTMRMKDNKLVFVVDMDQDEPAAVGEEYQLLEGMKGAFNGDVSCDSDITWDKWGSYISAYAPVFCEDGSVAGIVGIDVSVNEINEQLMRFRRAMIIAVSLFIAVSFSIIVFVLLRYSNIDSLTGIADYQRLNIRGTSLQRRRKLSLFTAVLVNIRDFKYLNQRFGTRNGDIILRKFAQRINGLLKRGEFVARTGNDNFLILIYKDRVDNLLGAFDNITMFLQTDDGREEIGIPVRCGIYDIVDGDNISEVTNRCSAAINKARLSNETHVVRFEKSMLDNLVHEKGVLASYRNGILRKEFTAYYQPKVDINTNTLVGAEALIRWIKDGKLVPPGMFIPILEKEGFVPELDMYVFDKVCQDIKHWEKDGYKPVRISSNFSKLHLKNPNFADEIIEIANKYDIDYKYLDVEITESSGYSDFDALMTFIKRMKEVGISVSMDDFGTGYSSLSMLRDVDVDIVKIDKSFVDIVTKGDELGTRFFKNVVKMIHDLERDTVSEGVETKQQIEILKKTECHVAQGYYYDKPLPEQEFFERVKAPHDFYKDK